MLLKSVYHKVLPSWLRGKVGLGLLAESMMLRREREVVTRLACHAPFSVGNLSDRYALTLGSAGSCYDELLEFVQSFDSNYTPMPAQVLTPERHSTPQSELLNVLFERNGSDKSTTHDYHLLYGLTLAMPAKISNILEIGIGSNNPKVVSNMGEQGTPGASLYAWRDYFPSARIFGADVDRDILFSADRIQTFFVDQLDPSALAVLAKELPGSLDLIIDDGLHSVRANLATLKMALSLCRPSGWIFVEDIYEPQEAFFGLLAWILGQEGIQSKLYKFTKQGMIFAVSPGRQLSDFPA